MHYPFSYQLASWFCWEVSTTCYFSCTLVPLRASRYTFFPIHLLHCYNHRSYQWSLPRDSEQACLHEPLLAQECRTHLLWVGHPTYSSQTASRLEDNKLPLNFEFLYNCTLTGFEPANSAKGKAMFQPYLRGLRIYVHVYNNSSIYCKILFVYCQHFWMIWIACITVSKLICKECAICCASKFLSNNSLTWLMIVRVMIWLLVLYTTPVSAVALTQFGKVWGRLCHLRLSTDASLPSSRVCRLLTI